VLSLKERFDLLERDLIAKPPRITVHQGLPFAVLRYEPDAEWETRRRARLLVAELNSSEIEVEGPPARVAVQRNDARPGCKNGAAKAP
jgi:hypothetical protein